MFGPNTHYNPQSPKEYCHRSKETLRLCASIKEKLTDLFQLQDYDLLLIPGPATVAMETVIRSCQLATLVYPFSGSPDGKFDTRWERIASENRSKRAGVILYCLFETSISEYRRNPRLCLTAEEKVIVDAVSAFPYYPLPDRCDVFVTTSCKLLSAPPGISIVGVKKGAWGMFYGSNSMSYFNIQNHRDEGFMTTAPVYVLEVLETHLEEASWDMQREYIDHWCAELAKVIPADIYIGDHTAPALTFDKAKFDARFPEVGEKFQLYPATKPHSKVYHVFTYSEPTEKYQQLIKELKSC
jgi:aspartate aminotransferase-like enzyme